MPRELSLRGKSLLDFIRARENSVIFDWLSLLNSDSGIVSCFFLQM